MLRWRARTTDRPCFVVLLEPEVSINPQRHKENIFWTVDVRTSTVKWVKFFLPTTIATTITFSDYCLPPQYKSTRNRCIILKQKVYLCTWPRTAHTDMSESWIEIQNFSVLWKCGILRLVFRILHFYIAMCIISSVYRIDRSLTFNDSFKRVDGGEAGTMCVSLRPLFIYKFPCSFSVCVSAIGACLFRILKCLEPSGQ